jgi:hypothetical protein
MPVALPSVAPVSRLPYVGAQILGDLSPSPTTLSARAVKRIRSSFPVPVEQELLWADVAFGTRCHGLVLTDAGVFMKDGPADDDDENGTDETDNETPHGVEVDGLGYRYVRWENFDPACVSHTDGRPTLDGREFLDGERFWGLAAACVRITNRRVRMRRAGKATAGELLPAGGPVRAVYRTSAKATFDWCFDEDGRYRFVDDDGYPLAVEVPADQYDALLQRMARAVEAGRVPELDLPDEAGVLVRRGAFTQLQAANVARTGRVAGVELREKTGSVVCRDPEGLSAALERWLRGRSRQVGRVDAGAAAGEQLPGAAAEAMAAGGQMADAERRAAASGDGNGSAPGTGTPGGVASAAAKANMAKFLANNTASSAGRTVGAVGARVLTTALGVTCAPVALAASLVLGDACGKAGAEALGMAADLLFEPEAQIVGRLFDGVLANVVFEYALTPAEQQVVAALMERLPPAAYAQLGAALRAAASPNDEGHVPGGQEELIRSFVVPICEAVRRA